MIGSRDRFHYTAYYNPTNQRILGEEAIMFIFSSPKEPHSVARILDTEGSMENQKEGLSQVTCAELIAMKDSGFLLFSLGLFLQKNFPLRSGMGTLHT